MPIFFAVCAFKIFKARWTNRMSLKKFATMLIAVRAFTKKL